MAEIGRVVKAVGRVPVPRSLVRSAWAEVWDACTSLEPSDPEDLSNAKGLKVACEDENEAQRLKNSLSNFSQKSKTTGRVYTASIVEDDGSYLVQIFAWPHATNNGEGEVEIS